MHAWACGKYESLQGSLTRIRRARGRIHCLETPFPGASRNLLYIVGGHRDGTRDRRSVPPGDLATNGLEEVIDRAFLLRVRAPGLIYERERECTYTRRLLGFQNNGVDAKTERASEQGLKPVG